MSKEVDPLLFGVRESEGLLGVRFDLLLSIYMLSPITALSDLDEESAVVFMFCANIKRPVVSLLLERPLSAPRRSLLLRILRLEPEHQITISLRVFYASFCSQL